MQKSWLGVVASLVLVACGGSKELPSWDDGSQLYAPHAAGAVPETPTVAPNAGATGALDGGAPLADAALADGASDDASAVVDAAPPAPPPGPPPPPMVAPGITTVDVIVRGFSLALRRTPSDGEVAVWRVEIENLFVPRITFLHDLVKSPEFPNHYVGLTNPQFVVVLYQGFLHRAPTSDEIGSATFALDRNLLSRGQLADYCVGSAEFALASNPEHPYFF